MNGVRILSTTPSYDLTGLAILSIVGFIIAVTGFVLFVYFICNEKPDNVIISIILMVAGLIAILGSSMARSDYNEHPMQYEVLVDEHVCIKDFLNRYEILEQRGDGLYIVREKVNE